MKKAKQPTFKQRMRLLEIVANELADTSNKVSSPLLQRRFRENAMIIADEAARMRLVNQKWEARRTGDTAPRKARVAVPA